MFVCWDVLVFFLFFFLDKTYQKVKYVYDAFFLSLQFKGVLQQNSISLPLWALLYPLFLAKRMVCKYFQTKNRFLNTNIFIFTNKNIRLILYITFIPHKLQLITISIKLSVTCYKNFKHLEKM